MNIVDNCLDKYAHTATGSKAAIRWEGEAGQSKTLSYRELQREVNRIGNALRALGLGKGDVIGVFMPMAPEAVVAMLAIIKIGGIFLPLFSGFGPQAIASRLADAEAKALFTADACLRRGKVCPMKPIADEAIASVASVEHLIVFERLGPRRSGLAPGPSARAVLSWNELRAAAGEEAVTAPTGADDPMMILYTSGTTGRPKGAVHTHCGFPIKAAQDLSHGFDLRADETLFWVTDMGWMMGPWLVFGALLLGATMMLYDGAPDWPEPDRLWALIERHRVTTLGLSPTLVRSLLRHGEQPVRSHDLSSLRKFGSTGEPWNPDPWMWLFETAGGRRLPIINYSGGTEISGGILCGNVLTPLKPCAFAGPLPGMAADVLDEGGQPVRGAVGELVIRQPWIGMTRGFWRDPQRYLETYWSRFPNAPRSSRSPRSPRSPAIWAHGDLALVDSDGQWYILGRSDDTIKVAGKRVGPAEIESILVAHPSVSEAAAIGVPDELRGEALACFCVLKPGQTPDDALRQNLKNRVATELGKPFAPHILKFVGDLPKTRNAKIMRRVIRAAFLGEEPGDISSLENPAALAELKKAG